MKIKNRNLRALIVLALFLAIVGCFCIDAKRLTVTEYEVYSAELPENFDGFKILQLSDLHGATFGKGNSRIMDIVHEVNPDLIVMTGDMADRKGQDLTDFYTMARTLGENYRVYYVFGNHEQRQSLEEQKKIKQAFYNSRVRILENEMVQIPIKDEKINLYGLLYDHSYYRAEKSNSRIREMDFTAEEMTALLGEEEGFSVVLAHNPIDFPAYSAWGADVVFSGHVHGGVVRLPFVGGLLSPDFTFFPKYDCGVYTLGGSQMVVSRGMGKIRIFNTPEIVVTTLKRTEK